MLSKHLPVVYSHRDPPDPPPVDGADPAAPLYQVAAADIIDRLLREHALARHRIEELKAVLDGGLREEVRYFIEGNAGDQRTQRALYLDRLFRLPRALKALDAEFWRRALEELDIWQTLPQARREHWRRRLEDWKKREASDAGDDVPPFVEGIARSTLSQLLALRAGFLAERVDGIFAKLSRRHATNTGERFGQRMILADAIDSRGSVCLHTAGHVHDLRGVVAKFMGDAEPTHSETLTAIEAAKTQWGQWLVLDGGALCIRAYRAGTLHLRVHPELCWRLNALLSIANPHALPGPRARRGAYDPAMDVPLIRPLPFAVRYLIASASVADGGRTARLEAIFERDKPALAPARDAVERMGGVTRGDAARYEFAVDVTQVLRVVGLSGCVDLDFAQRFAQVPDDLADRAIELAEISPDVSCLEPSAGLGRLARRLPAARTTCVELHALYSDVLRQLGCSVHVQDFLTWAPAQQRRFARIVMFPPAQQGTWTQHLAAALTLLEPGGRLVAILPADGQSVASAILPSQCEARWHTHLRGQFPGMALDVGLLLVRRTA